MDLTEISDGVFLLQHRESAKRSVLVSDNDWAASDTQKATSAKSAPVDGSNALVFSSDKANAQPALHLQPADVSSKLRATHARTTDRFWSEDAREISDLSDVESLNEPAIFIDSDGSAFHCMPIADDKRGMTLGIGKELAYITPLELQSEMPPRIEPKQARLWLRELEAISSASPDTLVTGSGQTLRGEQVKEAIENALFYVKTLDRLVRESVSQSFPVERMVYTIHWPACWKDGITSEETLSLHRQNIVNVARDYVRVSNFA